MESKDYHHLKNSKKGIARTGVWIIIALICLFGLVLYRFANSGREGESLLSRMPSSGQAYEVAQQFVRPALRSSKVHFADDGYEFGKKADSVYIIRSYAEVTDDNGDQSREYFRVIIKYNGGGATDKDNWELQDMNVN